MPVASPEGPARIRLATTALALAPFGVGYFLSYLFRAVNAIIEKDLVAEIDLSPVELGLVTAAYLGAFALFQLPLGVLLDRYGPRRVQIALLTIAASGAFLFAGGNDAATLFAARALIGLGFAGGLMASFKSVVIWVSEPRRALGNACVMSAGALGLLVATQPMEAATQAFGWRGVFSGLAVMTLAVALLIFIVVPERKSEPLGDSLSLQVRQIGDIFRDRAFLAITPLVAMTAGNNLAIQTLWAGPWLRDVAGLDRGGVAFHLLIMAVGFFIGILVTGFVADWFMRRGVSILNVMTGFLLLYLATQIGLVFGLKNAFMAPMWFAFGMLGQVGVLAYPWLASYFGAARSARAQTAVNLTIFATAFVLQYAIGVVIDQFPRAADGGYAAQAYQIAFGTTLALQIVALVRYFASPAVRAARAKD